MEKKSNQTILYFFLLSIFFGGTNFLSQIFVTIFWAITALMILANYGSRNLRRKSVLFFLLYYLVVIVYALMGYGTAFSFRGLVAQILGTFSILIFSGFASDLPYRDLRKALSVFFVSLLISVLGTTYVSTADPQALRIFGAGGGDINLSSYYRLMGMMSYSQAHALAILVTPLILFISFEYNKIHKIIGTILLLLIFRLLFVMDVSTALISAIVTTLIIFVYLKCKGSWKKIIFISFLILAVFYYSGLFSYIWNFIGSVEDVDVAIKLSSLSTIEGGEAEGDLGLRLDHYYVSYHTFLSNPIFGWGVDNGSYTVIGEHSFLLDLLAYYGLFALLLFGGWFKVYKSLKVYLYNNKIKTCYFLCLIPLIILISTKSMFAYLDYLFTSLVTVRLFFLHFLKIRSIEESN